MTQIDLLSFDAGALTVRCKGFALMLTAREFDLLEGFAATPRVMSYDDLRDLTGVQDRNHLGLMVATLREKIEVAWDFTYTIDCEHGEGYQFRKIEKPEWLGVEK